MSNTKKIALMSTLVLLLAVVAVFNFILAGTSSTSVEASGGSTTVNYFTTYRSERTTTRSEEFLQLDSIIAAYSADSAEYAEAVAQKQQMVSNMENELVIETIIKSLGFSDVAVAIGSGSENVNIFVNSSELTTDNVIQIFAVLEEELGIRNGNVIIMPIYAES